MNFSIVSVNFSRTDWRKFPNLRLSFFAVERVVARTFRRK
jgi:hypothetical protein